MAPTRLLPRSDQERLSRVFLERTAGGGLLQGIWASYCDRGPIPRDLSGVKVGAGSLSSRECGRLVGLSGHLGWGGALAPTDIIHGPGQVPPTGVVLRATRHPGHKDGISGCRE